MISLKYFRRQTYIFMDHVLQHPQLPVGPLCVHRRLERPRNLFDCHLHIIVIGIMQLMIMGLVEDLVEGPAIILIANLTIMAMAIMRLLTVVMILLWSLQCGAELLSWQPPPIQYVNAEGSWQWMFCWIFSHLDEFAISAPQACVLSGADLCRYWKCKKNGDHGWNNGNTNNNSNDNNIDENTNNNKRWWESYLSISTTANCRQVDIS